MSRFKHIVNNKPKTIRCASCNSELVEKAYVDKSQPNIMFCLSGDCVISYVFKTGHPVLAEITGIKKD